MKPESRPRFLQRSRIDIVACILKNSNESSNKTRLMRECNLNSSQLNLFRGCLVEARFLKVSERNAGTEIFETTEEGKEFLRDYGRIKGILDKERRGSHILSKEKVYRANPEYLEESTFIVIVEMLERLPLLKPRIKKYLEAFSS